MNYELVDTYFEIMRSTGALAESTLRSYGYAIRDFCRHLEKLGVGSLDEASRSDVFDYVRSQMDRGVSPATIDCRLVALRSMFRNLNAAGLLDANPISSFGPRRPAPHKPTRWLSADEAADYLDGLPAATPLDIRNRALAEVIYGSAIKVTHLVALNVDDLSLARCEIITTRQPLSDESRVWLAAYLGRARDSLARRRMPPGAECDQEEALFLSRTGRRLGTRDVARALRRPDGRPVTATALRHSLLHALLKGGASPLVVHAIMGWSPSYIGDVLMIHDALNPPEALRRVQVRAENEEGAQEAS